MNRRPIRVMPQDLALKIAAGEVVERPASVVKELLDNALDAEARHIHIHILDAGMKLICVTDDGCGIPASEMQLAFRSHATSKVAAWEDLDHLRTLGFRGEALPSIAAVSRVDVHSRIPDEAVGARLSLEFGETIREEAVAARAGTRVSVMDLFANVPARRKFVRSLRAEAGRIGVVVADYVLAQPSVAFLLEIDGRETLASPGTGSLQDAIAAVYGTNVVPQVHPVAWQEYGIEVDGVVGDPALSRATRSGIHLAVNGRPIANRSLAFALEETYSGFLMTGRHPIAAIGLTLLPEEVDPNIHPAKNEVRFAREREVHGVLHRAVSDTLLGLRLRERPIDAVRPDPDGPIAGADAVPAPLPLDVGGADAEQRPLLPDLPLMRVFGQTNLAFIVAEGPAGLYMIDQHAAHERILFDRFDLADDPGEPLAQPLLEPVSVDLEPGQMAALEQNRALLEGLGLQIEPFGTGSCLVRAVPAATLKESPVELTLEVLDELAGLTEPDAARERALAAMACRAAVKAGQTLTVEEMRDLVLQLERTPRPNTCPHGRPTMIHLSHTQLEREFGRR